MSLTATLFLAGSALAGAALLRRASGRLLDCAEQIIWGTVAGWMLSTLGAYAISRAAGRVSPSHLKVFTFAVCVAALLLLLPTLSEAWRARAASRRLRITESKTRGLAKHAGLAVALALFAPAYWQLFRTHMLAEGEGGVYSGGSTWYDIGFHTAITNSFLHGQNFPPVYTPMPPAPLLYPFLPDFQTAALVALGMSLHAALFSTGFVLALAVTGTFYSFAQRILDAQRRALLATVLFLLNGGLGFVYFFFDFGAGGKSSGEFWSGLEVNYANMGGRAVVWTNLIVDTLLPQRTSLYGLACALMIFTLFAVAWRRWHEDDEARGPWDGARALLMAGALAGMLPLFHPHSYIAVGLVSGFLFLLRPRRAWLAFWLPAVALAAPRLVALVAHAGGEGFLRFQPGWRGHNAASWTFFWLVNMGVPLVVALPAWLAAPRAWRRFYLAFALLFAFAFAVVVSPNDYDNIKLMYYWHAANCVAVAAWLARLATTRARRALAVVIALASVASGLLALQYENASRKLLFSRDEIAAAEFAREHTPVRSLFLTAPTVHQPVLSLAGRAVVRGDTAWLWSHGYAFREREADVKRIYAGAYDALELLAHYRVGFVYLGPRERQDMRAREEFFDAHLPVFYRAGGITIYDARQLHTASGDAREFASFPPREFASRLDRDPAQFVAEFPRAGYAVYRYYLAARGAWPKYAEFLEDLKMVGRGVYVGREGWERQLEANKFELTEAMMERAEFAAKFAAMTDEEFVSALYANAGVRPREAERVLHVRLLTSGAETRSSVFRRVAENRELYRREYNAAYMLSHFFAYLRRNPDDPPDRDLKGFRFWLDDLDRTGDYRSVGRVFIESGEYKDQIKNF